MEVKSINIYLNMFPNFKTLITLVGNLAKASEVNSVGSRLMVHRAPCNVCGLVRSENGLHTSAPRHRGEDRKQLAASMPRKDDGASGESSIDIDSLIQR